MAKQSQIRNYKMSDKRIAAIKVTEQQHAWLIKEREATGNPMSAIVRGLIQKEIAKSTCNNPNL